MTSATSPARRSTPVRSTDEANERRALASSDDIMRPMDPSAWVPDAAASACMQCNTAFGMMLRRHHCRWCGLVLCKRCCSETADSAYHAQPQR
eukprot:5759719-Prymnesium_polylepis.1